MKALRQQQADYIDQLPHLSAPDAHHAILSAGTYSHNAEGKCELCAYNVVV